ncbi:MAG: ABC-ATPase domain-containing protein [Vicinamibacteria bacterium]
MANLNDLHLLLDRIDGRGYKAYKEIAGTYEGRGFTLHIDHVQGDPFAAPSKIRLRAPQTLARIPIDLFGNRVRRIALQDFLCREVQRAIAREVQGRRGAGKSGMVTIDAGGQEVLERTAMVVTPDWVEARVEVGLPAEGRTILGRQAEAILCRELPKVVEACLVWSQLPHAKAQAFVECVENQESIRRQLDELGLVAFLADGAILPRESGIGDRPLDAREAVTFRSPDSLRVSVSVPHPVGSKNSLCGMGIPRGVTLIVGGGYHGKSTLLEGIERGVYPHVPADGREYVVTSRDAVKIRAEDGRRVERVDISPFISNLPFGKATESFSTDDASGSTSQATNIIEAVEVGATTLLLDEDTSATNFMVRDARMQALVHKELEPITSFLDRVRELYDARGVSTILVMGGSGDYFDAADKVILMRDYLPQEVTAEAKKIARARPTRRAVEAGSPLPRDFGRVPVARSFDASRGKRDVKIDAKGIDHLLFGREPIDLRGVEQLVDASQTRAIGHILHVASGRFMDGERTLPEVLELIEDFMDREGLDALSPFHRKGHHPGSFARPRKYEIAAAINRLRTLRMRPREESSTRPQARAGRSEPVERRPRPNEE